MQCVSKCVAKSVTILTTITTILLTLMVLNVFLLVLMRYIFLFSFSWSEELTRYLMIWMGLIGSSLLIKKREHIRMKFILDKLPDFYSKIIDIFFYFIESAFLLLLIYKGAIWAISMKTVTSPAMQMSMLWVAISIPISAILMLLYSVINIAEDVKNISKLNDVIPANK